MLVVLLLVALSLITLDFRSGSSGVFRNIGSSVFGPIENGLSDVFRPVGSWFSGLAHLSSYKTENDKLRSEVDALRNQLAQSAADERAFHQLQQVDGLANRGGFKVVHATVTTVSAGGLGLQWTAAINAGSLDGIRPEETVITGSGLLGKTIRVSRTSSTILLAIDPSFAAGCFIESNGHECKVGGNGLSPMKLTLYGQQQQIAVGDRLVTAGSTNDSPFVPQVPIGMVTKILGTTATGGRLAQVQPFVDFTGLGGAEVGVITVATRTIPHGALLPPKPSPSSSAAGTSSPGTTGTPGTTGSPGTTATPGATGTTPGTTPATTPPAG